MLVNKLISFQFNFKLEQISYQQEVYFAAVQQYRGGYKFVSKIVVEN